MNKVVIQPKKKKSFNIFSYIEPQNVAALTNMTGNTYESIMVIAKRANQIALDLKEELHQKLDEFSSSTDTLEEIHENKEQIEISRYYERLPHATLIALDEFKENKVHFKNPNKEEPSAKKSRKGK